MMTEAENEVMEPQAQECWDSYPPNARRDKGQIFLSRPQGKSGSAGFQTPSLQNGGRINVCCFKPRISW